MYISQNPFGFTGKVMLYGYTHDPNPWIDPLRLKSNSAESGRNLEKAPRANHPAHHIVMTRTNDTQMNALVTQMKTHGINPDEKANGIWLSVKDSDKVKCGVNTSDQQDGLHGKQDKQELFNSLNGKGRKEFRA